MKTLPCQLIAAAAGATLLASCAPQLDSTTVPMSSHPAPKSDGSLTGNLYAQVNAYRVAKGIESLPRHDMLDRMARQHSEFMRLNRGKFMGKGAAANISHDGFEERALMAQHAMNMNNVSENVATCGGNYGSVSNTLLDAWIKSSGHDKNMRGAWDFTGIGVVVDDDGTVFATQLFATENHSPMVMRNRLRQF